MAGQRRPGAAARQYGAVIRVLAERENVDPETDPRPRVLATVFGALATLATRAWRTSGGAGPLAAAFDHYAAALGPALAGHWSGPRVHGG